MAMDDDAQVGTLLLQAVRTLDAPTERLVAGGLARGRRRVRLIRGAEAFTGLGVLAGVAALVVALLPSGDSTHGGAQPGAASPPVQASTTAAPARDTVLMTPQALLQTALDTLPRAGTTSHYSGNSSPGQVGASFVYDDGHGPALVSVSLEFPLLSDGLGAACQISVCRTLADGSRLAVYQGNGHPGDPSIPGKDWEVILERVPGGTVISITEFNSAQEKSTNLTRPDPPFTVTELTNWTGNGRWQQRVSADFADAAAGLFTPGD
jgi:hypothetical protein